MTSLVDKLFVYGSLRKGFHHPAYRYISDHFHFVGEARVKGLIFDMGDYPAGLPAEGDHVILGELYQLNTPEEFGWAFAQLDDYEGVDEDAEESALYRRELVQVLGPAGVTEAWIYWYNRAIQGRPVIASGDVLEYWKSKNSA
jgi:gamma-glutamylcyclotransferase (GGCT)/AIG2-like uncharacterized protein YtfP